MSEFSYLYQMSVAEIASVKNDELERMWLKILEVFEVTAKRWLAM